MLEKAPKTMAIIGAGAVGCEFADVFNAFGTQVTLIEVLPNILPLEDAECSAELASVFKKREIDVITGAKIGNVKVGKDSVAMTVESGGAKTDLKVDVVLVAAGRAPVVEDIGLKEAGVQLTERGFIKINEQMETSAKGDLRDRRCRRPADARAQGLARRDRARRAARRESRRTW